MMKEYMGHDRTDPRLLLPYGMSALDVVDAHPEGLTQKEVAAYMGIDEREVRRIEERALAKVAAALLQENRL